MPLIFSFSFLAFSLALTLLLGEAGFLGGFALLLGQVEVVDVIDGEFGGYVVEEKDQLSVGAEEADFIDSRGGRPWKSTRPYYRF